MTFAKRSLIFVLSTGILLSSTLSQSTKSGKPKGKSTKHDTAIKLNPKQIDFMTRLDYDMRNAAMRRENFYYIFSGAYGGGHASVSEVERRISAGLKDSSNLPAIVACIRSSFSDQKRGVLALSGILSSLDYEECEHLSSISDAELKTLASKYSCYLQQQADNIEKYSTKPSKPQNKSKKHDALMKLNPKQNDLITRLDYDMQNAKREESIYLFFFTAYGGGYGAEYAPISVVERRISAGLKDPSNLPAIVARARAYYGWDMAVVTLKKILPSLNHEECEHLNSISDTELNALASKYSGYLKQTNNIEKY